MTFQDIKLSLQVITQDVSQKVYLLRYSYSPKVVCEYWNHRADSTEWQSLQCSLAVPVVRFVSHRTFSVHKAKFLKLETVSMLMWLLY